MDDTRDFLMTMFWTMVGLAAFDFVCCEFLGFDIAIMGDCSAKTLYIYSTVMILLTLALVPLALRLFKFRRVHYELMLMGEYGLFKWGTLRLAILGVLLNVNTMMYYIFGFEPTFGYLAVVTLLAMPFVYPTMKRCFAEVEDDTDYDDIFDDDDESDDETDGDEESDDETDDDETTEKQP